MELSEQSKDFGDNSLDESNTGEHQNEEINEGHPEVDMSEEVQKISRKEKSLDHDETLERRRFLEDLYGFMAERGHPISKPPSLGFQELDLYRLYKVVTDRGGMDVVTAKQEWKLVYNALGIPTISTSASYNTRTNYKKYLYLYELEHFETEADKLAETMDFKFKRGEYVRIESTVQNQVYYAKIVKKRFSSGAKMYYIHYNGWSTTHDEWMPEYALQPLLSSEQQRPSQLSNPPASRSSKSNYLIEDPTLYPTRHPTGRGSKKAKSSPALSSSSGSVKSSNIRGYDGRNYASYGASQDEWHSIAEEQPEDLFKFSGASPTIRLKLPPLEKGRVDQYKGKYEEVSTYRRIQPESFRGLHIFHDDAPASISTLLTASEYEAECSDSVPDHRSLTSNSGGVRGIPRTRSPIPLTETLSPIHREPFGKREGRELPPLMSTIEQRRQRSTVQPTGYFFKDDPTLDLSKEKERMERERFNRLPLKPDLPPITIGNLHTLATISTESESDGEYHIRGSQYTEVLRQLRAESQAILERAKKDDTSSWKEIVANDLKNQMSKSLTTFSPEISNSNGPDNFPSLSYNRPMDSSDVKMYEELQKSFRSTMETVNVRMGEIRREIEKYRTQQMTGIQTSQSETEAEDGSNTSKLVELPQTSQISNMTDDFQIDPSSRRRRMERYRK